MKAVAGTEAKKIYNRSMAAGRINYFSTDPNFLTLNTGSPSAGVSNNGASPYQLTLFSEFARVDYSYNDRYLLSGTVRRDGSSVFDVSHRYGTFPSVTAGWRISQEDFMKSVTFINDLKLRVVGVNWALLTILGQPMPILCIQPGQVILIILLMALQLFYSRLLSKSVW